ncbi:MAG TPA: hypothetical protein VFS19_05220 [Planctomycetota bacterium]|nr:hypothetical protein [Planctomycetota bacterium]
MKALPLAIAMLVGLQDPGPWRIVFEQDRKLWSMREDGSNMRAESADPAPTYALSPDGKRRAYVSRRDKSLRLAISDADGKNENLLTPDTPEDSCSSPQWTPDGKRLVFARFHGGKWQICIVQDDGTNLVQLTDHPAGANYPRVATTGEQVSYLEIHPSREKLPGTTLRAVDFSGKERKVVVEKTQILGHSWSPKGDRLAVSLVQELRILDMPSGKTAHSIDYAAVNKKLYAHAAYGLVWKPDGSAIACTIQFLGGRMMGTKVFGDNRIFILSLDGKHLEIETTAPAGPVRWTR